MRKAYVLFGVPSATYRSQEPITVSQRELNYFFGFSAVYQRPDATAYAAGNNRIL
jgi:hypothetical protein